MESSEKSHLNETQPTGPTGRPAEILAAEDTPQGGSSHWCCSYLKEMNGTAGNPRTPSSIKHRQWCYCRE